MENVYQYLRDNAETTASPLSLPDHDDLVLIEEEILMPLPPEFKHFLLEVSDIVYGAIEPVTATEPSAHTHLSEVTAVAWSLGVSRELVPICFHKDQYYCVTQESEVVLWKDGELDEEGWDCIEEWVKDVWLENPSA